MFKAFSSSPQYLSVTETKGRGSPKGTPYTQEEKLHVTLISQYLDVTSTTPKAGPGVLPVLLF